MRYIILVNIDPDLGFKVVIVDVLADIEYKVEQLGWVRHVFVNLFVLENPLNLFVGRVDMDDEATILLQEVSFNHLKRHRFVLLVQLLNHLLGNTCFPIKSIIPVNNGARLAEFAIMNFTTLDVSRGDLGDVVRLLSKEFMDMVSM